MWQGEIRRNPGEGEISGIVGGSESWRDSGTREGMNESGPGGRESGRE